MRVNADAEQSYDDLTGAALTGIEAHAIEAEAELKTAREKASSAQTTPTKEGGGNGDRGVDGRVVTPEAVVKRLDDKKFKQLDALLDQTTIYSQFLSEQMDDLDEEEAREKRRERKRRRGRRGKR